jgi:DNA-binding GntR family transcriptional regulator
MKKAATATAGTEVMKSAVAVQRRVTEQDGAAATTLMQDAYRQLEEMIVTAELAPGEVVSEAILSRRIGIGTTPIREALHRLSREYLVQIMPRRGVVVTPVDVGLQFQVLETRREVDRLIARSAAQRATAAEREAIAALAKAIEDTVAHSDVRAFLRLDAQRSRCVAYSARNSVAAGIATTLHSVSRRFWFCHLHEDRQLLDTARLHLTVAKAVVLGDAEAAGKASDELIDYMLAFAKATLPGASNPEP